MTTIYLVPLGILVVTIVVLVTEAFKTKADERKVAEHRQLMKELRRRRDDVHDDATR